MNQTKKGIIDMPKHKYDIPEDKAVAIAQSLGHTLERLIAKANSRSHSEFTISPSRLIKNAQQNVQGLIDQVILMGNLPEDAKNES